MFKSISNNFGAGTIQFKDYQCDKYVVLNARFVVNSNAAAYKNAEKLVIKVPDLAISRSYDAGVAIRFIDRRVVLSQDVNCDGGTVLRSRIEDKNTISIEHLHEFDDRGDVVIYINAMYAVLNQGDVTERSVRTRLEFNQETPTIWAQDSAFFVEDDHWVFVWLKIQNYSGSMANIPWDIPIKNFPTDVDVYLPFFGGLNRQNPTVDGISEARIAGGNLKMDERVTNFDANETMPFAFAYLVRDGVTV